jgi:GntR family transcriptional regulator / MocR family aminotransferase
VAVDWVGVGPTLLVELDRSAGPVGRQLQDQLRRAIRSGRLTAGERLPATRVLADQLGVSRGVVVDAFAQLESEGYLDSSVGSGTFVAAGVAEAPSPSPVRVKAVGRRLDVDFEYGVPDLGSFPMRDWSWAMGEACRTASLSDLGDELGVGSSRLREVLAAYLRRVRSSAVEAEQLVVCPGFRHGLSVVLRALAAHGMGCVALEDPGPLDHAVIARRAGLTPLPVAVDDRGIDVEALGASDARAVVVTPAHQCPTGVVLVPERRLALIEWARRVDGYIIEDDYDAEFRYDRQPVGSMQGLAPDRVIAMGSVSKTLAPTLRLGWIACPPQLLAAFGVEKQLLGRGAPGLDQLALAALIESGRFDRHLRHMRGVYARRRDALVSAVARHAPGVEVTGLAAGCHAVLRLPAGVNERAVVEAAEQRGVGVYGMSRYRKAHTRGRAELVIGFGGVSEQAIVRGVKMIADLLTRGV